MFQSRTNFVFGIILLLKRKVILGKAITYVSGPEPVRYITRESINYDILKREAIK